jgi:hypothetical protein
VLSCFRSPLPTSPNTGESRRPAGLKVSLTAAAVCGMLGGAALGASPASAAVRGSGTTDLSSASVASHVMTPCLCPVLGPAPTLLKPQAAPAPHTAAPASHQSASSHAADHAGAGTDRQASRPAPVLAGSPPAHAARTRSTGRSGKAAPKHQAWHPAKPAKPGAPYLMYDSVTPGAIPPGKVVATYATGGYAVPQAAVARRKHVVWIDTQATDPGAGALDVEPGDATPPQAATWVAQRLARFPKSLAVVYTMQSEWPATQAAIATLPPWMRAKVRWWIADPTGYPHVVPGSDATQWYWGHSYDISTVLPRF